MSFFKNRWAQAVGAVAVAGIAFFVYQANSTEGVQDVSDSTDSTEVTTEAQANTENVSVSDQVETEQVVNKTPVENAEAGVDLPDTIYVKDEGLELTEISVSEEQ